MKIIEYLKKIFPFSRNKYKFYKNLEESEYPKYLKKIYKEKMGQELNLKNPQLLTEKIQWIKLYDNLPIKGILANKLLVANWVKEQIPAGDLAFPEIYGIYDSFDEIDFEKIPEVFIIKTNHGFKNAFKVFDKKEFLASTQFINNLSDNYKRFLNINYAFLSGFELQYKNIEPKIFIEENIAKSAERALHPYCITCFNGKAVFLEQVCPEDDIAKICICDKNWEQQSFSYLHPPVINKSEKPKLLEKMIEIAETLAKGFKLVRVDIYEVQEKLYLSEITFTPSSGFMFFEPKEYDKIIGDMLVL